MLFLALALGLAWTPDTGVDHWNVYVSATSRGECVAPADCAAWVNAAHVITVDEPSIPFKKLGLKRNDPTRYYVSITAVSHGAVTRFGKQELVVTGK